MTQVLSFSTLEIVTTATQVTVLFKRADDQNAINLALLGDLSAALDHLDDHPGPPVVIFRGEGGNFSRGIDLRDFPSHKAPDVHGFNKWERQIVQRVERLGRATIAAIDGRCEGGGAQLALACDLRVATRRTLMGFPEVKQGFLPGMATWRLAKYVGLGRAKNLLLTGRALHGLHAMEWGLLDEVCDEEDLDGAIRRAIEALAPVDVVALQLARRLLGESFEFSHEAALGHMLAAQHRAISSPAFLERLSEEQEP